MWCHWLRGRLRSQCFGIREQDVEKPMGWLLFALFGGIFLFVVMSIVFAFFDEKKRRQEMGAVAGQLGLEFTEQGSPALANLDRFALFNQGREWRSYNIMRGAVEGVRVAVFDYRFTTGGVKNQTTYRQTVCAIFDEKLDLPRFELKPEGFFHKLEALFGYQDIDFSENTEFSRKYVLRGASEDAIRAVFTSKVLSFFEASPGLNVEGGGDTIILFRAGERLQPGEIPGFLMAGIRALAVFRARSEE